MPDYTIASQVKAPDSMATIGSMMGIANTAQQMQVRGLELQKLQQTFQPAVEQARAESRRAQVEAGVSEATAGPRIERAGSEAATAKTQSTLAQWQLDAAQAKSAYEIAGALITDPSVVAADSKGAMTALMGAEERMRALKIPEDKIRVQMAPLYSLAAHNPAQLKPVLANIIKQGLGASGQATAIQPQGPVISSGQVTQPINLNPLAGPTGPVPGAGVQQQLPPTTPAFNPQTNAPGYVGPQPSPQAPVQSGPALGAQTTADQLSATVQADVKQNNEEAKSASQDIGVLQAMKQYAKGAVTGVASDKAAYMAGLAGYLGMSSAQLAKTDTDLLAKNEKMLALAGGNTNLAKTMAEGANPHTTMTAEAIRKAADQVIAQKQIPLNKQKLLLPYINSPQAYMGVLTHFNAISDPRVLQYPSMTDAEKREMKKVMTAAEREEFGNKLQANRQHGFIP